MDNVFNGATLFNNGAQLKNYGSKLMLWDCALLTSSIGFGDNSGLYKTNFGITPGNAVRLDGITPIQTA